MLRKFLWNAYDHLGAGIVLNVLWAGFSLPWFFAASIALRAMTDWLGPAGLFSGIVAAIVAIWLNPATLALLGVAAEWADYRSPDRGDMVALFRRRLVSGLYLSVAAPFLAAVIGANGAFYLGLSGALRLPGALLAGIMLWAELALLGVAFHLGLALARDPAASMRECLRRALYLALALPFRTAAVGLVTFLLAFGLAITGVGAPLVALFIPAVFAATAEREIIRRLHPRSPEEIEADRLEEVRTFRDLVRPWDVNR